MSCCTSEVFSGSSGAAQTVAVGGALAFNKNIAAADQDFGSNSITLDRAGLYQVNVSASGAVASATAGTIGIQLQQNGQNVTGAYASTTYSASQTDIRNVAITAVVRVNPTTCPLNDQSVTLTVVNTGVAAVYNNVMITVSRLAL